MSRAFIIDPTISAIDGLYDLLGIGIPNQGGILYSSLEYFEKALEELAAAFPGDGWLGSAADKYAGKNRNHVNFFQELADLDRQLISLIHDQANAVQTTRDILEGAKKGLEFVRPVAVDLTYIPVVGHALSAAFQAPFGAGAMAVVGGALAYLVVKTLNQRDSTPQIACQIGGVGRGRHCGHHFGCGGHHQGHPRRSVGVHHKRAQRPERALGQAHGVGDRTVLSRVVEPGVLLCGRPRLDRRDQRLVASDWLVRCGRSVRIVGLGSRG